MRCVSGRMVATVHLTAVKALCRALGEEVREYGGPLSPLEDQREHLCGGNAPPGAAASGPPQRQLELARSAHKRSREALEKLGPSHHLSVLDRNSPFIGGTMEICT